MKDILNKSQSGRRGENFGVLLLNMGGPENEAEIRPYLTELFSDPDIIQLPLGFIYQKMLAKKIASKRAPMVAQKYAKIGGGSPLKKETKKQAEKLSGKLNAPVRYAMRYSEPGISGALKDLSEAGAEFLVVLPLYPQYSFSTTRSSLRHFQAHKDPNLRYKIIDNHYSDSGYLSAMASLLKREAARANNSMETHILFAAHSIPLRYTRKGDPYIRQVEETASLIYREADLAIPCSIAYQSRVGPVKWHGPALEEEMERLVKLGIRQLVVQPVSFVSENLETLYDLDIEFKQRCETKGIRSFIRVPAPGTSDEYIHALSGIVMRALQSGEKYNA